MTSNKWMIDVNDAVLLLIDHQSGLFQLVRDMEYSALRNNVTTLATVFPLARLMSASFNQDHSISLL